MKNTIYIIILFISYFSVLSGQVVSYMQFSRMHTNTNASVFGCIMQDSLGMIWAGTNKGLFSYDGYSFFQHNTEKEKYETRIYCGLIHSDSIFIGTDNGLFSYNTPKGTYYDHRQEKIKDIRCFTLSGNELWIGTLDGLFRYNIETKTTYEFPTDKLPHKTIYSIIKAADGNMYVGTYNGLCKIDNSNNITSINIPTDRTWKNIFVNVLLENKEKGIIWIGTEGNLFRHDINNGTTILIPYFTGNSIKSLSYDSEKNLLIGTDNGLYVYSSDGQTQKHYIHDSRNSQSISNNIIWCITTDKAQNIWLGTDNGISYTDNSNKYTFIPVWELSNTNDGNMFYTILKDSKGRYWFGGTDGLLQTEGTNNIEKSRWFKVGEKNSELSHNRIRHIFEDKSNDLWIATDGSIERYDDKFGKFIHYSLMDSTYTHNSNWAYYISEDNDNNLWISSCLGGIFVVNKNKLRKCSSGICIADKNYTTANGLKSMFVKQTVTDKKGNAWVVMYNTKEIQKIDSENGKIYNYSVCTENDEYPEFLICDSKGMIWISTNKSISRIDPNSGIISKTGTEWKENNVLHLAEIDGNIWISSAKGLFYVNKETLDVKKININGKIFSSLYYDKDNRKVYMGSYDGIGYCEPEIINDTGNAGRIYLTALSVNNDHISKGITASQHFTFNYKENNLKFEFSDFQYNTSQRNGFMYMMSGIDSEWHYVNNNSNIIVYNNMPYGNFELYVKHMENSDIKYKIANIKILPPIYLSIEAKVLYILLAIGLVCWIINFFVVKNRLHIEKLEKKKILEQTRQKIRFMSNLSHDLKNPVGMIVTPVSKLLLETKDPKQKEMLNLVYKNAVNLNAKIHKLIEMNRVEDNEHILITSRIELISSIHEIYEKQKDAETEGNHIWNFSANVDKLFVDMDVIKLESIIGNLLSNAMKYTPTGGKISVGIIYNDEKGEVNIKVSDNGIGIPESEQAYIFQRFFQSSATKKHYEGTGIGLYLVKTYTELHNGTVNVFSNKEKTVFSLTFPIDKALNTDNETICEENDATDKQDLPTILIVDDNKDVYNLIKNILSDKYKCIYAQNGKQALEILNTNKPDLIITDYMMPVMNGLEMCKILKKNMPTATIPIIMLSAKDDSETIRNSIKLQIDAFIQKPFDAEILTGKVELLIHKKETFEAQARIEKIGSPKQVENSASADEKFLINITKIIEDHIADSDLNVNALSELSGTGSKQIYRKIKQLTGFSPVEYIKSIRMKKAAMLLQQKKFSVAEVMYMVGYSNPSYFSKSFQSIFGKTPKQYSAGNGQTE